MADAADASSTCPLPPPTPPPLPTGPPAVDASASLSALASLVASLAAQLAQRQETAPAQAPSQQTFPAFISSETSPAGKSLPNIFPSIEASLLLAIARHEFRPIDLCKLDSRFRNKADIERLESAASRVGALKEYPSLHALLVPLHSYFAILQAFAASAGDVQTTLQIGISTNHYLSHLVELHQLYEWSAVVQYHMEFHLHRRQEMSNGVYSGWARPDQILMTRYLFGRMRTSAGASSTRSSGGKQKRDLNTETCFAFNKGSCTATTFPDGHVHKCCKCSNTDHGEKACPKA